jgi:hypothetical protein
MADLTQFDLGSAARVARVVRAVEQEPPRTKPMSFSPVIEAGRRRVFRVCTFTGAWPIDTIKTVTLRGAPTTPNTVSVTNITYDLPNQGEMPCSIAKDGTAWYLVGVKHTTADVIVNATLGTAGLVFTRARVQVVSTATVSQISVGTTACD